MFPSSSSFLDLTVLGLNTTSPPGERTRGEDDVLHSPSLIPAMMPTWKRSGPEAGTRPPASAWSRLPRSGLRRGFLEQNLTGEDCAACCLRGPGELLAMGFLK